MKKISNLWILLLVFITSLILISCSCKDSAKTNENNSINNISNYEKIASKKYSSNYSKKFNKSNSFVLICSSEPKNTKTVNEPFSFFVYNIEKEAVIYEQSFGGGSVEWLNDRQIKVSPMPGIVKGNEENESSIYVYDVLLKKKINTINDNEN